MSSVRKCCKRGPKKPTFDDGRSRQRNQTFLQKMGESFLMGDLYAEPITLNFKGRNKFVSVTGGVFSLIVRIFILGYFTLLGLSKLNQQGERLI